MTAIAYRDGIMAADSMMCIDEVKISVCPKIRRFDGTLIGCMGDNPEITAFEAWMADGARGNAKPNFARENGFGALRAMPDGTLQLACYTLYWETLVVPFFAIGSASTFLFGALYAGASAEEAVRLAIQHTLHAGGEVQVERLKPAV